MRMRAYLDDTITVASLKLSRRKRSLALPLVTILVLLLMLFPLSQPKPLAKPQRDSILVLYPPSQPTRMIHDPPRHQEAIPGT